jgi:hypothetical protein
LSGTVSPSTALNTAQYQFLISNTNTPADGHLANAEVAVDPSTGLPFNDFSYGNINTATTTTLKSSFGLLHSVVINTPVASATITLYDSLTGSGTKIGTITLPSTLLAQGPYSAAFDCTFVNGLTVVTTGTTDITINYR